MQRRSVLLGGLALGSLSVAGSWLGAPDGSSPGRARPAAAPAPVSPAGMPAASPGAAPSPSVPVRVAHPRPRVQVVDHLPGRGPGHARDVAITIDDGVDTDVVKGFLDFAQHTGTKITFFPNGCYRSWTDHQAQLRRLVERGLVQVGNHTWSHPDLTTISDRAVFQQIDRNDKFLTRLLGVSPRPWFRPPYGAHDARVDRIAADLGYERITMWGGTFGDDVVLTPDQLLAQASEWLGARRIVIGHANHPAVTHCYGQLAGLLRERRLTSRTLAEAFAHE